MEGLEGLGRWLLERLGEKYSIALEDYVSSYVARVEGDPFKILVATILSQNSTDKAALKAFKALQEAVGVDPQRLAAADKRRIMSAIRVAGLHSSKAAAIKSIARIVIRRYGGSLSKILALPPELARGELLKLPHVGPKTSDVLLVNLGMVQTVPVDTHIFRIAKRLGIVGKEAGYEEVRRRLDSIFEGHERHRAHLLLIAHGRKTCKATKPMCDRCPIKEKCRYYLMNVGRA